MTQMRKTKHNPRQNPVPPILLNPLLTSCTPIRKRSWSLRNRKKSNSVGSLCYQTNFLQKTSSWTGSTYNRNRTLSSKVLPSSMHSYKNYSISQTKNTKSTQNSTQSKPKNPKTLKTSLMILNELFSFNFLKNKLKITFERGTTRMRSSGLVFAWIFAWSFRLTFMSLFTADFQAASLFGAWTALCTHRSQTLPAETKHFAPISELSASRAFTLPYQLFCTDESSTGHSAAQSLTLRCFPSSKSWNCFCPYPPRPSLPANILMMLGRIKIEASFKGFMWALKRNCK
jgi:hypothetical protein